MNLLAWLPRAYFLGTKPADGGRSPRWPSVRADWLKDHDSCRACGGVKNLQVHHKRPFHLHPELELDKGNLITLCECPAHNCHFVFGHFLDWKDFNPGVEQAVTLYYDGLQAARRRTS